MGQPKPAYGQYPIDKPLPLEDSDLEELGSAPHPSMRTLTNAVNGSVGAMLAHLHFWLKLALAFLRLAPRYTT